MCLCLQSLCDLGYSAMDIITTVFRVVRNYEMHEIIKLEFIKVMLFLRTFSTQLPQVITALSTVSTQ